MNLELILNPPSVIFCVANSCESNTIIAPRPALTKSSITVRRFVPGDIILRISRKVFSFSDDMEVGGMRSIYNFMVRFLNRALFGKL